MEVNETKKYITIKQAARLIGVTELTLRNWDKAGKFVAARHPMNNYRVYTINQVENLLARMDEAPRRAENRKRGPRRLEIKVLDDELPSDNLSQPSKN
ncbi:MAG TPA: MerR family DNA-binding transcriptional regulator [Candidatus Paceibacterota bacterium]